VQVANGDATGAFALGMGVSVGQGVLMECITSILLTMAVLMAAVELSSVNAAFAIGFAILIDILARYVSRFLKQNNLRYKYCYKKNSFLESWQT